MAMADTPRVFSDAELWRCAAKIERAKACNTVHVIVQRYHWKIAK
jgi:hypothetical protein